MSHKQAAQIPVTNAVENLILQAKLYGADDVTAKKESARTN